jgi:hypothetical protein
VSGESLGVRPGPAGNDFVARAGLEFRVLDLRAGGQGLVRLVARPLEEGGFQQVGMGLHADLPAKLHRGVEVAVLDQRGDGGMAVIARRGGIRLAQAQRQAHGLLRVVRRALQNGRHGGAAVFEAQ